MRRVASHLLRAGAALAIGATLLRARHRRAGRAPAVRDTDEARRPRPSRVKHWLWHGAVVLVVLAVVSALGVVAGVVPIGASGGHWAVTRSVLSFAMQRAVSTRSLAVSAPSLDEPWLVLKGGAHYESGCGPCHGSPALGTPRIAAAMTPHPPHLPSTVSGWTAEELYYIVKHGVKFTGMPAWPAVRRDDEVWAMVAFLRRLPELDAAAYRRLVDGAARARSDPAPLAGLVEPARVPAAVMASCARCHGIDGNGRGLGAFPKLAGQRPGYLLASLEAFAQGQRHSGVMEPIVASLNVVELRELAEYYASQPGVAPPVTQDADPARARGEEIALRGIPSQRVPACAGCHTPGTPRNPVYPELAGQYPDYLMLQLAIFKDGVRGGTAYAHIMRTVANRLTRDQMRAAALYYASLPPAPAHPSR